MLQDPELMDKYLDRRHEIHSLKSNFSISAMAERNQAQQTYSKELWEVRRLWANLAD